MGLLRGKIRWTIPGAGTAWSVLHFDTNSGSTPVQTDADDCATKMAAWVDGWKANCPNVVQFDIQPEIEEIVETTGAMLGIWTTTTIAQKVGGASGTSGWAAAAGAVTSWSTAGVRNNRRVRGRTFIVPLSNECWDTNGTIKATELARLNTGATALRNPAGAVTLCVYARPTAPGATDGEAFPVLAHRVPDMSAILRSRRS